MIQDRDSENERDDDLTDLFENQAQRVTVPPAIDARIFAAARQENEVQIPTERRAPRWLAVAAVMLLAVALVPLTRQAPKVGEDNASGASLDSASITAADEATSPAARLSGEAVHADRFAAERSTGSLNDGAAAERRTDTITGANMSSKTESLLSSEAGVEASESDFRATPATWLAHLRERLASEGHTPAVRDEYVRFREQHPRFEPGFAPDFD